MRRISAESLSFDLSYQCQNNTTTFKILKRLARFIQELKEEL